MGAVKELDNVCSDFHQVNMLKVQYKYHLEDVSCINAIDPVTSKETCAAAK
jgi:hypothetical protein